MSQVFLREQRHIFGICPHCLALFRLPEVKISYGDEYRPDWYEELEEKGRRIQDRIGDLEDQEHYLRRKAIESARRTQLPRLLKRIAPVFTGGSMSPQDVKTIFHPVDYVAFGGMSAGRVEDIVLLDQRTTDRRQKSIQSEMTRVIRNGSYTWRTIRVQTSGNVTVE